MGELPGERRHERATAELELIEVTDRAGRLIAPEWLARAERVHRQLRPQLPVDYAPKLQRVFQGGGRMLLATRGERVLGLAIWRAAENTFAGRYFYVDDLVTDEEERSRGVGSALLARLQELARELACDLFELDSGVQRTRAHRFYFREGLVIEAYKFSKPLAFGG